MDVCGASSTSGASATLTVHDLPKEVLLMVFSYLSCEDLFTVSTVCTSWNNAVSYEGLWKKKVWTIPKRTKLSKFTTVLQTTPYVCNFNFEALYSNCTLFLKKIVMYCDNLQYLQVHESNVDPEVLETVFKKFQRIKALKIGIWDSNAKSTIDMLSLCPNLEILIFVAKFEPFVTLTPVADGCPRLYRLNIRYVKYNVNDLVYLLRLKSDNLLSLVFSTAYFPEEIQLPIHNCRHLNTVVCEIRNKSQKHILDSIGLLPVLKYLSLVDCRSMSPSTLANFFLKMSSPHLLYLQLINYKEMNSEVAFAIKSGCPRISTLCVATKKTFLKDSEPPDRWLEILLQLPRLTRMKLRGFPFSRTWFQHVLQCTRLKSLTLWSCENLKDQAVRKLITKLKLERLELLECVSVTGLFLRNLQFTHSGRVYMVEGCGPFPTTVVTDRPLVAI